MASKNSTASFMLRFTQQLFKDDSGKDDIMWRGRVSHVQDGEEKNFTEVEEALEFIQQKLATLTLNATSHKSKEEQEGLLGKSFDIWKKMTKNAPKMIMDTIKDPQSQVANIREQLTDVGEEIGQKLEIDSWRTASRSDMKEILIELKGLKNKMSAIHEKLDEISST